MRAVQTDFSTVTATHCYISELPRPQVQADDVLVEVKACGIFDLAAFYLFAHPAHKAVCGHSISGVVRAVGGNVQAFKEVQCLVAGTEGVQGCRSGPMTPCLPRPGVALANRCGCAEHPLNFMVTGMTAHAAPWAAQRVDSLGAVVPQ